MPAVTPAPRPPFSMRRDLVWVVASLILVSGALVGAAMARLRLVALQSGERLTESFAQVVAEQTARTFQTVDQRLLIAEATVLRLQAEPGIDEERDREALRREIKDLPFVRALSVADRSGVITASSETGLVGRSLAGRAYFQVQQEKPESDFEIGTPLQGLTRGVWFISATRPLRSADGAFAGLIIAAVESSHFQRLWGSAHLGPEGSIAMFRRDGLLMMRSPFDEDSMGKAFPGLPVFAMTLDKNPSGIFHRASAFDGVMRVFAYRVLPSRPEFVVVVGQSYDAVLASWRQLAALAAAVWVGVSASLVVLLVFLNRTWLLRSRTESQANEALQRQQTELRVLFDLMPAMIWFKDTENNILRINERAAVTAGKPVDEIEGHTSVEIYPREAARFHADDLEVIRSGQPKLAFIETVFDHDGRELWVRTDKVPYCDKDGKVIGIVVMAQDITEARRVQETLRESEERFAGAFEQAPIGVALVSPDGRWLKVNRVLCDLVGFTEAELLARTFQEITHPEDLDADLEHVGELMAGTERSYQMEKRYVHARGHHVNVLLNVSLVRDSRGTPRYFIAQMQDITARKRAEAALASSLREKEGLLKEVHHRVKNNLQVITSLLRLETRRSGEAATQTVLKDMQARIHSMALLHEMLYRTGNFARVDLADYLSRISTHLVRGQSAAPGGIRLELELSPIQVEIDQAIPAALIVNELLSNALKHGFPDGHTGELRVVLRAEPGGLVKLVVSDTGAGLPAEFEARRGKSLGLQLVFDLARQLGGELTVGPPPAALFTVTFPLRSASGSRSLPAAS